MLGPPHLNKQCVFNSPYFTIQTLPRETDLWQHAILSPNKVGFILRIFVAYWLNISFRGVAGGYIMCNLWSITGERWKREAALGGLGGMLPREFLGNKSAK